MMWALSFACGVVWCVQAAVRTLSFTDAQIDDIFRVATIILWLGNLQFEQDNTEKSSITTTAELDIVASLLGVSAADVTRALCCREITMGQGSREETLVKPCTAAQVSDAHSRV